MWLRRPTRLSQGAANHCQVAGFRWLSAFRTTQGGRDCLQEGGREGDRERDRKRDRERDRERVRGTVPCPGPPAYPSELLPAGPADH